MDKAATRALRLHHHRLSAPAPTVVAAASHMLAVQAQEFWGGRWALAARTQGEPTLRDVDAAFDRGELVRSWTMRGTIHALAARDLAWMLGVTGERQIRMGAATDRREGLDESAFAHAEALARQALRAGNRLARKDLFAVFEAGAVSTAGQRGYHLLTKLSKRGVIVQGPVVPREGSPTREQYFVLTEEWITDSASPADPLAELFVRFVDGHGPASAADFAWWAGLPLGPARAAAEAAAGQLTELDDGVFVAHEASQGSVAAPPASVAAHRGGVAAQRGSAAAPPVIALPPFDEYYLSYVDRSVACPPEFLPVIGPAKNGIVRPILLAGGQVIGAWAHSHAIGRHVDDPIPELLVPGAAPDAAIVTALDRYRRFVIG